MIRYENQDELDSLIAQWTGNRGQDDIVAALRAKGVPAASVQNASQLLRDKHLRNRGLFEKVDFPQASDLGSRMFLGRGWQLSDAEVKVRGPAPQLGEGNDYVLGEMLGLPPGTIEHLRHEQVIGDKLKGGAAPNVVPLARQAELGWIAGYESGYDSPEESGE